MPIVGTAGHVDHGKSTLVEALTGRDPDRWAEEKARGLTIDLGFAWTGLGGHDVGFVDVPGHERFIKNMLAGMGAIDVALFVVAADEGWMPQSEEHLAVLDLLEVRHGVIAATRADLVDDETAELATLEIAEMTEGTSLESWPIIPVSAITGLGMDQLIDALAAAIDEAGEPPDVGRPRLWVDRAFTISGAGTVVTGTLTGGKINRGDELWLWPPGGPVRVRGVQSHEEDITTAVPGSRTALNLAGTERTEIHRGAMIGRGDQFRTHGELMVHLRPVRSLDEPLTDKGAFHVHIGSGTWPARLRLPAGALSADGDVAVLRLDHPVPVVMGDYLVVREVGRRAVVAGGRVLDPAPASLRHGLIAEAYPQLQAVVDAAPDQRADALLERRGIASLDDLARDSAGGKPTAGLGTAAVAIAPAEADRLVAAMERVVVGYHAANPMRPGIPKASLASALEIGHDTLEALIASGNHFADDGATVRRSDFAAAWSDANEAAWQRVQVELKDSGFAAPRASQLGLEDEVMHALLRDGRLVRVGDDLAYLPEQLEELQTRLAVLPPEFTVADFRDEFGITRRQAVPLLEWLDARGTTSRRGDVRTVRDRKPG